MLQGGLIQSAYFPLLGGGGEPRRCNPAPVRHAEILLRSERNESVRIEPHMAGVVVPLDVIEVDGPGDRGPLIEFAREFHEVRIVGDPAEVALEVQIVDRIEPDQSREQALVRFRNSGTAKIAAGPEQFFELIQGAEDVGDRLPVFCLACCKPRAVDAVIDVAVQPFVQSVDV